MKRKIFNILILSFVLFVYSCDSEVDSDPSSVYEQTVESYFKSSQDYEDALIGAYDPLQWGYLRVQIGDIASDNSVAGGESATDVIGLQEIDLMTHYPVNENLRTIWRNLYEGVNRCNFIVQNIDKLDFSRKQELLGEVYFLRAYYYAELTKFWGDIPLFTEARLTADQTGTLTRSSQSDVYIQVETDLLNAIAVLPNTSNEIGRANKRMAQALLGKVYLYQEKFSESAAMLDEVINSGQYNLVADFASIWLQSGENNEESIFEIQHTNTSNWYDWSFYQGSEGNFGIIMNGPRAYSGDVYATGWSFNIPSQELFDRYNSNDTRRDATILDMNEWIASTGASYSKGYKDNGLFNHKYITRAGYSGAQLELNYLNNYRIIRYADVLLMAAEAYNRGGLGDTKAQEYLNLVRSRAGLTGITSTGGVLTTAIWEERRLELAFEGHRFFDLVRTGQASSVIAGFQVGKNELFPINNIDAATLGQNPGY
ncbi:hypothetical protein UJ101_00420 [Flavobacteriaceae bacterium UJ101]|nr:hypothetical protein UJ101_00420 [Flavobacteriaceae bacterium UJ101]